MNLNLYQESKQQKRNQTFWQILFRILVCVFLGILSLNLVLSVIVAQFRKEKEFLAKEIANLDNYIPKADKYDDFEIEENKAYLYDSMLFDLEQIKDSKPKNLSLTQINGSSSDELTIVGDFKTLSDYEDFISNLEERGYIVLNSYSEKLGFMSNRFHLHLQF